MSERDTRERILEAAVEQLRRFGPAKTTVLDVARALEMSHGNVYRHFPSKQALFDAVTQRWLSAMMPPLEVILHCRMAPAKKLVLWLSALMNLKREKVLADPEMFAAYHEVANASRDVVQQHLEHLRDHVAHIIREGVDAGDFRVKNAPRAAQAVLDATSRFHHPHFVRESAGSDPTPDAERVFALVVAGLKAGAL